MSVALDLSFLDEVFFKRWKILSYSVTISGPHCAPMFLLPVLYPIAEKKISIAYPSWVILPIVGDYTRRR